MRGLEDFVLEHDPEPVDVALDEDEGQNENNDEDVGNRGVGQWLHQVLRNDPRPTFLLPSAHAGPDVMFELRKTSGTPVQRLVCAVQVCGKSHFACP